MEAGAELVKRALQAGKATLQKEEGTEYVRFRTDYQSVLRGTVVIGDRVVYGYPHIKRIFTLAKGIRKNIKTEKFYVEEKIDGFNLRVANVNGKLLAFSRGGFIDWFATEKIQNMKLGNLFRQYSEYVLCGEMIGNTPYTRPTKDYDVKFLVFDIDKGHGEYTGPEERYRLLKKYSIESVPGFGAFTKNGLGRLEKLMLNINKGRKEGLVIKSSDRKSAAKMVTPNSDIEDIRLSIKEYFELPLGFITQRLMRSAMSIREFGLEKEKYAKQLGNEFYSAFISLLDQVEKEGHCHDEFEILVNDELVFDKIAKHMSKEVRIEVIFKRSEKGGIRIRFRKIYKKTSKLLKAFLNGKGITD